MAVDYPTFHHWVGHCLIIVENNQVHQITAMEFPILHSRAGQVLSIEMDIPVQTQVRCHFLLPEMKLTITRQEIVIPLLGIRCHHGNKIEEETTKEDPCLNQVIQLVLNFIQEAQEISEQIFYKLEFIDLYTISVFCGENTFYFRKHPIKSMY